jgi:anaerobic selenocysteine-containing dehydrogenase
MATEKPQESDVKRIKATCRMCHGGCGTIVELVGGKITKVVGDPDNPVNRGLLCSKAGVASIQQVYHPDRIDTPMIRVGAKGEGLWRRATWDEALEFIAGKLNTIKVESGAEAVAFGRGTGVNNHHLLNRVANLFGTPNVTSIAYYCYGPRLAASRITAAEGYGAQGVDSTPTPHYFGKPKCIVQWGSQKRTSNDHGLIGHGPLSEAMKEKPFNIIVDPRKSKAAGAADIWLPLRPGSDTAMALGWMNIILNEELYDKAFVSEYCYGFQELRERVRDYTLEKVSDLTWCDPEAISTAARKYATTRPACMGWGTGTEHIGINSFQATRSLLMLMAITGNLDVPGGNVFYPLPKLDYPELSAMLPPEQHSKRVGFDRFPALQMTPHAYAQPSALFNAMLNADPYQIRAYVLVGMNAVTSFPNSPKVVEALKKLELFVVHELWMTPTAELADIVLPACGNLEREDPRIHLYIRGPESTYLDTVSRKVVELGERRSDWEFLIALGQQLGFEEYFPSVQEMADTVLAPTGKTWDDVKAHDRGLEFPIEYYKYRKIGFATRTGKFELYSTVLEDWGHDPLPFHEEPPESPIRTPSLYKKYNLILNTGAKMPMYWNSQGRQIDAIRSLMTEPLAEIHPTTAAEIGIKHGDFVWVETARGRLRMKANVSEMSHPRVVTIPHSWWLPEAPGPDHAISEVCSNMLTDDSLDSADRLIGASPLKAMLCRIVPAEAPALTVTERWKNRDRRRAIDGVH